MQYNNKYPNVHNLSEYVALQSQWETGSVGSKIMIFLVVHARSINMI